MAFDRKLIKNGNGWALTVNAVILALLEIDPEIDLARYSIVGNKLVITKSENKISEKK